MDLKCKKDLGVDGSRGCGMGTTEVEMCASLGTGRLDQIIKWG